ncbi:HTH-type transcriptional activator RhaR [Rubritalea halochordaticola]|uniref:HTH-type transcriptional activator RhaR n=1 Tax=Rubritalea halochordaticola TaxID=714537 RepID=A0ABP9UV73_9BACT
MNPSNQKECSLSETHIFGQDTTLQCIRAHDHDTRDWIIQQPVCNALQQFQMEHAGIMHARSPYEVVRMRQQGAFFMVTTKGRGRILTDKGWHLTSPGEACLLPAYTTNAFHCIEGIPWDFCWVRYEHPEGQIPLINSTQPVVAPFESDQFLSAMQGMLTEATTRNRFAITQQWVRLIHIYVSEFIAPYRSDDRLWRLWSAVEDHLDKDWDLPLMAKEACMSGEHLRRLCHSQHGRSPIQQLRWLRMQRAAALLVTSDHKIESIAYDVGYKNPIVFSTAFKREFGVQPSTFRADQAGIRRTLG